MEVFYGKTRFFTEAGFVLRWELEAEVVDEVGVDTACKCKATIQLVIADGDLCFLSEYSVYNFVVVAFVFEYGLYLENLPVYGRCCYNVGAFYNYRAIYDVLGVKPWLFYYILRVSFGRFCAIYGWAKSEAYSANWNVEVYGDAGACFCFGGDGEHCGQDEEESEELFHNF